MNYVPSLSFASLAPFANGIANGANLSVFKHRENTVKQGKNYILSVIPKTAQAYFALNVVSDMAKTLTNRVKLVAVSTVVLSIASLGLNVLAAIYKHNYYKFLVEKIHSTTGFKLSDKPSPLMGRVYDFVAEHSGDLCQIVAVVCSVAQFILGQQKEAISTMLFLGLGFIDRQGYLPARVSGFYNQYIPIIGSLAGVVVGSPLTKIICTIDVVCRVAIPVFSYFQKIFDGIFHGRMANRELHYPTLKEVEPSAEAPATMLSLTKKQILEFNPESHLYVNPSHAQRSPSLNLNVGDVKVNALLTLFDGYKWDDISSVLEKKVLDDERWKNGVAKLDENAKKVVTAYADAKEAWKQYVTQWAEKNLTYDKETTKYPQLESMALKNPLWATQESDPALIKIKKEISEAQVPLKPIVFKWAREQLVYFVDNINLDKTPVGDLTGFSEIQLQAKVAVKYMQKIHADSQDSNKSAAERKAAELQVQDMLLKLAIEGGDYCVQGISGAVRETFDTVISQSGVVNIDWRGRFDLNLHELRKNRFLGFAVNLLGTINPAFKVMGINDRHITNIAYGQFGHGLGLDMNQAKRDLTIEVDSISQTIYAAFFPQVRFGFWQNAYAKSNKLPDATNQWGALFHVAKSELRNAYDEKAILDQLTLLLDNKVITAQDVTTWWRSYINDHFKEEDREELVNQILYDGKNGAISHDENDADRVSYSTKYLKLMLVAMGYLQEKPVDVKKP